MPIDPDTQKVLDDHEARIKALEGTSPPVSSATAVFKGLGTQVQGKWQGYYGGDGYALPLIATKLPTYVKDFATFGKSDYTWVSSSTDPRAVQKPGITAGVSACWYGKEVGGAIQPWTVVMDLGPTPREVDFYCCDWDGWNRRQKIQIVDDATGVILDTQEITSFKNGVWLFYQISGKVRINFVPMVWPNAVLQAICFGGASAPVSPPPPPPPPPPPAALVSLNIPQPANGYGIQVRISSDATQAVKDAFIAAAQRWMRVIIGPLSKQTYQGIDTIGIVIDAKIGPIDGTGGILGSSNYTMTRASNDPTPLLPCAGMMQFDSADLTMLQNGGQLKNVILHEMGHAIGVGTLWFMPTPITTGLGGTDPRFIGANAVREYQAAFSATGTVPIENTGGSGTANCHWREGIFGGELMTGWIGGSMALSRITGGSLMDQKYAVNLDACDPYAPGKLMGAEIMDVTGIKFDDGLFVELPVDVVPEKHKHRIEKRYRRRWNR